ncbi:membrane bound O-acyl transferase family-domain-containing protein [Sphaerosporella brunnea]|uniref:Membrane bound O-acyl transferase family-domain-containing protein n=1 Tax=Sphaerosporella brunnea TaxID=1250544 RepID=A0A5J5F7Z8_9PEZI|nr:membrane bound O-acyl transferase family-domain-containing protein [Sphaerosporella brunnea]
MALSRLFFGALHFPLLTATLLAGSKTPPKFQIFFFLLHLGCFLSVWRFIPQSDPNSDFIFGCGMVEFMLRTASLHLLADPWHTFRRHNEPGFYQLSPYGKLKWAVLIVLNSRGIGWSWEVPKLPPVVPYKTRLSYLFYSLRQILYCYLLYDLSRSYMTLNYPYFATFGVSGTPPAQLPFVPRLLAFASYSAAASSSIYGAYEGLCIIWLLFGAHPEGFNRPIIGQWNECYTVRRFWGRCWHQTLRWPRQSQARPLAYRVFGAKKGSNLSNYTQVFYAFLCTALSHWAGQFSANSTRIWEQTILFFIGQGFGIMFEDFVIAMAKRLGVGSRDEAGKRVPARWATLIGRVWTFGWFFMTAWGYIQENYELEMAREDGRFTLVGGLLGNGWRVQ